MATHWVTVCRVKAEAPLELTHDHCTYIGLITKSGTVEKNSATSDAGEDAICPTVEMAFASKVEVEHS